MKRILAFILAVFCLFALCSCDGAETAVNDKDDEINEAKKPDEEKESEKTQIGSKLDVSDIKDVVEIEMSVKGYGVMSLELYHDIAPVTVENFVKLACDGFYDGTIFHRVIEDFVIQGGDPEGTGTGGSDETIYGEFVANGFHNELKHERGVISMEWSTGPDSATSRFFIVHEDSPQLNGQYAAFGKVTEGIEVVDMIATEDTDKNARPVNDIVIEYVTVTDTYDRDYVTERERIDIEGLYEDPICVEMSIRDYGEITLELYPRLAPITVGNFVSLAEEGFYDGLIFHRVIKDFMIQGGDPEGTGMGGSGKNIKGEFSQNGVFNPLSHKRGVISMARGSYSMDSASSQFFICHADNISLNGSYAAFGRVIEGIEIVDKIAAVKTNGSDKPLTDVVIEYVRVSGSDEKEEEEERTVKLCIIDESGVTSRTVDPYATGKLTIINFWGTWCTPCVAELPAFDAVAGKYDNVAIIAVHTNMGSDTAPDFIAKNYPDSKITFACDAEGEEYYTLLGGRGTYPYTVILDEDGNVIKTIITAITYEELENTIKGELKK